MITELLLLDIETVPQSESFAGLDSGWQALFSEKASKTVPEDMNVADMYRKKAGILAEFGKIICISTAFFYENEDRELLLKMKMDIFFNTMNFIYKFLIIKVFH